MSQPDRTRCDVCSRKFAQHGLLWREDAKLGASVAAWIRVLCLDCARRFEAA